MCIHSVNFSSVHVARSSVRRESETDWGPGAADVWELLRFGLRGGPPPMDGDGGLQAVLLGFPCCNIYVFLIFDGCP